MAEPLFPPPAPPEPLVESPLSALSEREYQVLTLIAEGKTNEEIAHQLILGSETIKSHVKTMLRKLVATNRAHAVAIAIRNGLIC